MGACICLDKHPSELCPECDSDWIRMADREPGLYQKVRVRKASGAEGVAVFTGDGWIIRSFALPEPFELDRSGITRWMPLLAPPRADGQEDDDG